jgi:GON domain
MSKFPFRRSALVLVLAIAFPLAGTVATAHASNQPLPIPGSCADIHKQNPKAKDGNYALNNATTIFTVYCYDMSGTPREYINLAQTGANANYSQYTAGGASPGTNVRTTFTKLRIDPATLTVDIGDLTFATSTGSLNHSGSGTMVTSMPYGAAMSCGGPGDTSGAGNINLQGTPFQVAATFALGGFDPAGSAVFSADNQQVSLAGGGDCGWITPSPAMYNPFNPSLGEYHLQLSCAKSDIIPATHQFCITRH